MNTYIYPKILDKAGTEGTNSIMLYNRVPSQESFWPTTVSLVNLGTEKLHSYKYVFICR